jgi:hypothetical protein
VRRKTSRFLTLSTNVICPLSTRSFVSAMASLGSDWPPHYTDAIAENQRCRQPIKHAQGWLLSKGFRPKVVSRAVGDPWIAGHRLVTHVGQLAAWGNHSGSSTVVEVQKKWPRPKSIIWTRRHLHITLEDRAAAIGNAVCVEREKAHDVASAARTGSLPIRNGYRRVARNKTPTDLPPDWKCWSNRPIPRRIPRRPDRLI